MPCKMKLKRPVHEKIICSIYSGLLCTLFFINSLILSMQETISLIRNPEGWTVGRGGSKPKRIFVFPVEKVHSEIHPTLEKKWTTTVLLLLWIFSGLDKGTKQTNPNQPKTTTNKTPKPTNQAKKPQTKKTTRDNLSNGFWTAAFDLHIPNHFFHCRRDTVLSQILFLPSVIPCFSFLFALGDSFLQNYTTSY